MTVPAVVAEPEVATLKLATCVVLVTVNGAVPVAIVDTKTPAVPMLPTLALPVELSVVANTPVVPKLPTLALPETLNVVNVPIAVKLDVTTVDFNTVPDKLAALAVIAVLLAAVN